MSYSRHDEAAVTALVADLERADVDVWLDRELRGGDAWWTEILDQIRRSQILLFALSDTSLASKPCRSELTYAQDLGLPILPVQIGDISSYRVDPIFSLQSVDYRSADTATGFTLVGALYRFTAQPVQRPDPMPDPPPIPYEYLQRLGAAINGSAELPASVQRHTLFELRAALDEEREQSVRDDIMALLHTLLQRHDVTRAVAAELSAILGEHGPTQTNDVAVQATPADHLPDAQLRALYVEARAEIRAKHHDEAIRLLDAILGSDAGYRDAASLRETAWRQRELEISYEQASAAEARGDWTTAIRLFTKVIEAAAHHPDAASRRDACVKAQRVSDLEDELRYHAEAGDVRSAADVVSELVALEPGVIAQALGELDRAFVFEIGLHATDFDDAAIAILAIDHSAEAGDPAAMVKVADRLGAETPRAVEWYAKAAEAGDLIAKARLKRLPMKPETPSQGAPGSERTPKSQEEIQDLAAKWQKLDAAANKGSAPAMNALGVLLAIEVDPPDLDRARYWYEKAADAGNAAAMANLGWLLNNKLDPPDVEGARHWYERAAQAGNPNAMTSLGFLLANKVDPPDLDAAQHWYERAIEAKPTVVAMNNLGYLLLFQRDPPDVDAARRWYEQAARAGSTDAMVDLGWLMGNRLDPPDLDGARHWYQQGAEAGDVLATNNLGALLAFRIDPPDLVAAQHWLRKAADAGYDKAMNTLGILSSGLGESVDLPAARDWYEQAIVAGSSDALIALGDLLASRLQPRDVGAARQLWREAAAAGQPHAMIASHLLPYRPDGEYDITALRRQYELAAGQGDPEAMVHLGVLLGRLTYPPELDSARHWLERAAELGSIDAMESLAHLLTTLIRPIDPIAAQRWTDRAAAAKSELA